MCLVLAVLWLLVYSLWHDLQVDRHRQKLFALRSELFSLAATGAISFHDPAYTLIRKRLNAQIRFAHEYTLVHLMFLSLTQAIAPSPLLSSARARWEEAVERVQSKAVQEKLRELEKISTLETAKHMVASSPVMIVLLVVFSLGFVVHHLTTVTLRQIFTAFAKLLPPDGIETLEYHALMSENS